VAEVAGPDIEASERMTAPKPYGKYLIGGAIALFIAAVLLPASAISYVFGGFGLIFALGAVWFEVRRGHTVQGGGRSELNDLIFHDDRCVFITAGTGEVLTRNAAARKTFGDAGGDVLEQVICKHLPNPSAIIFRLQAKALRLNAAREDVVTRTSRFIISVHKLTDDRFLWAIEESADRVHPGRGADKISLPMLTASASGTILFMNEAMRHLAGGRAKSVDRLFKTTPQRSGETHNIKTHDGDQTVQVIMVDAAGGRTEYFLNPIEEGEDDKRVIGNFMVLEDFPVALFRMRADGAIEDANKLARDLLDINDTTDVTLADLIDGLGRPMRDWLGDAAEGKALHQPEVMRAKGGDEERYLQMSLGRVLYDGEVSLIAMVTDATELKTLEAQFVQSQKMQAIGQLAGGVAHDFNNLLTAISGHCDLLMLRHDPGDMDYGDLEQINQNANRAASLVSQLLAFSRKQNLQLEVLDMRDTLSDLTHLLNRLVGAQISLNLTHDPQLQSVRADRRQLEQVIMNRGDYVVVKVRDNGSGIPLEKLSKIFEPFFTTKRTGEGTGLGLSTAYGIIKQSGGFIFVDSIPGKGTEFTIFFPTYDRPSNYVDEAASAPPVVEVGPVDGVVLLVEDEAPVRAFASRALQLRGFKVLEADSGEEALEVLKDEATHVDLVVTDVVMPGLDGPSWVREARKTRPDMKVVFVSGYSEENFSENESHIPNSVFLPKPFSLDQLTSTVRAQLMDLAA